MSVIRYGEGCTPAGQPMFAGLVTPEPDHSCPGGQTTPGVLGGWTCPCECHQRPTPHVLWKQAETEHPDDIDALRRRYRELMVEHGHLIPGKPEPLPCGWPVTPSRTDRQPHPDVTGHSAQSASTDAGRAANAPGPYPSSALPSDGA